MRLGLLLGEVGRANSIVVGQDEMARAIRTEAMRYPGQQQQVFEFFRQNPRAAETLRGPLFEEKVIDFILELAKVEEKTVPLEELTAEPPATTVEATQESTAPTREVARSARTHSAGHLRQREGEELSGQSGKPEEFRAPP